MGIWWWFAWWFGTFMTFHSVSKNHHNWRTPSFLRGVGIPSTRYDLQTQKRFHWLKSDTSIQIVLQERHGVLLPQHPLMLQSFFQCVLNIGVCLKLGHPKTWWLIPITPYISHIWLLFKVISRDSYFWRTPVASSWPTMAPLSNIESPEIPAVMAIYQL